VLKEGKPGISVCGPGLTRCAGSNAEQGRWEKVAAGKTEDLTAVTGERAAFGKGAADARGPGVSEGSGRAGRGAGTVLAMRKGVLGRMV